MREWLLIYHDGNEMSVVSDTQQLWNDAPVQNVQALITRKKNYYQITQGIDEYLLDYPNSNVKFGKLITDEQWREIRNYIARGKWDKI